MKKALPCFSSCTRLGDRVIRVSRRQRGKFGSFLSSITSLFRFGGTPRAR